MTAKCRDVLHERLRTLVSELCWSNHLHEGVDVIAGPIGHTGSRPALERGVLSVACLHGWAMGPVGAGFLGFSKLGWTVV